MRTRLEEERVVVANLKLHVRTPLVEKKDTPLKFTLEPEQVLSFVQECRQPDIRLMALLGYFFSLRPFEVFALKKSDLRAGTKAAALECCKTMERFDLYDKLAVEITKQRVVSGKIVPPKSDSKGWVACFSEDAAKLLVEELRDKKPDEILIGDFLPDWNIKRWTKDGIKDITIKDLRRASLYWLGHTGEMDPLALKHHARHARFETTLLYVRRSEENAGEYEELDLEA